MVDIVQFFDDHFEIVHADTPDLKGEAFRLRYSVLSQELCLPGFEPWNYPDGLETDQYDEHSAQCLLKYKPTASWVGTVRLVLADPADPATPFPVEVAAKNTLDRERLVGVNRRHLAEISRLIIAAPFRHRHENVDSCHQHALFADQRHIQLPLLGLMAATFHLTVNNDVTDVLAAMEPNLARLLSIFGIEFTPIGPEISYSGIRRPYYGNASQILKAIKRRKPRIWEILCGVCSAAHSGKANTAQRDFCASR